MAGKIGMAILAIVVGIVVFYMLKPESEEPLPVLPDVWWGEGERKEESADIQPFKVEASESDLEDLQARLKNTRYFKSLEDAGWKYGARPDFIKKVVDYWLNKFSWRKQEKLINSFPHFKTNIDGISLHFLHIKPSNVQPGTKVVPLLLLHGWPGSFFEFYKAIPMLMADKDGLAFELVVPSLPGYGFSSPARKTGMGPAYMAVIFKKLMNRLGHSKFYIQGGDCGSIVCRNMAALFPGEVIGAHLNFWPLYTNRKYPILTHVIGAVAPSLLIPEKEQKHVFPIKKIIEHTLEESGYLHIQGTKPDTVGFGLNDSPAGLAAYILEKFVTLTKSDTDDAFGSLAKRHPLDEVLTNIMIYWLTGSMPTAVRFYKETLRTEYSFEGRIIHVPIGFAAYPDEVSLPPKSWLQATCKNLVSYTEMKSGGHFAAFEEPETYSADVRMFVGKVEAASKKS